MTAGPISDDGARQYPAPEDINLPTEDLSLPTEPAHAPEAEVTTQSEPIQPAQPYPAGEQQWNVA